MAGHDRAARSVTDLERDAGDAVVDADGGQTSLIDSEADLGPAVDWSIGQFGEGGKFSFDGSWLQCFRNFVRSSNSFGGPGMLDIDPTVDFVCKMLLGNPKHSRLTLHFLNAVLRPSVPIVTVEYLNPINEQEFEDDKLSILDILASDELGRRFNIEVQRTVQGWLPERLTYYAATQLVEQIGEGDHYQSLRPSIGICILKGKLFPTEAYWHQFRLRTLGGVELTHCLEIHTLELPKYRVPSDNVVVSDPLEEWVDFFCSARGRTAAWIRKRLASPIFEEAVGVLEMISKTPEQRRYYQARLKWELDENTRLYSEAAAREESEARGRAVGRFEERVKQIQDLRSLLNQPPGEDAELANLSLEQLELIINNLQREIRIRLE